MMRVAKLPLLVLITLLAGCSEPDTQLATLDGATMGTRYQITAAVPGDARDALAAAVQAELDAIDIDLSTWRDDSAVSHFNRLPAGEWFSLPPRMAAVLKQADTLSAQTGGALDLTLAPLSRAWGFQGPEPPAVPAPGTLGTLTAQTGMHLLEWSDDRTQIRKRVDGLALDFSALGKGYAVDRLSALLRQREINNALVEIGGELMALGLRPDGAAWRVALDLPRETNGDAAPGTAHNNDATGRPALPVLRLSQQAVATSGDYRNYFLDGTQRYGHVLDPASGRPAAYRTASTTVIANDAITADALATAFMAMPPELAFSLAQQLGVELLIVSRGENGALTRSTSEGFPPIE